MGKGKDARKSIKTPPTKTAKEKKAEKRLKKANKDIIPPYDLQNCQTKVITVPVRGSGNTI